MQINSTLLATQTTKRSFVYIHVKSLFNVSSEPLPTVPELNDIMKINSYSANPIAVNAVEMSVTESVIIIILICTHLKR